MTTTHINRLRCSISNTPGASGDVVVGAATSAARRTFTAAEDGKSFEPTFEDGNNWEVRTGCVYTHSTATLTRGTLVDSSTGSAIALTSAAIVGLHGTAKAMQDLEPARGLVAAQVSALAGGATAGGLIQGSAYSAFKLKGSDVVDAGSNTMLLLTTSDVSYKSTIGAATKPTGVAGANSDPAAGFNATKGLPWSNDTSYVTGSANVTSIVGGYDHVVNQLAGTIVGGGHNFMPYNVDGHSTIVGGSNNRNASSQSAIVGGTNNTLNAAASYAATVGGVGNTVSNAYAVSIGGSSNIVTGDNGVILTADSSTVSANYGVILAGYGNAITHASAINIAGSYCTSEVIGGEVLGRDTKISSDGDSQALRQVQGLRTTDATNVNFPNAWLLRASVTGVTLDVALIGVDEATGNIASYTYSGAIKWAGSGDATLYDAGGNGTSRAFTQLVDQIGVAGLPTMNSNIGSIRCKAFGKAATNIKWSAIINAVIVRV